jgi:hypothetical protein
MSRSSDSRPPAEVRAQVRWLRSRLRVLRVSMQRLPQNKSRVALHQKEIENLSQPDSVFTEPQVL